MDFFFSLRFLLPLLVAVFGLGEAYLLHVLSLDGTVQAVLQQRSGHMLEDLARAQLALQARPSARDTALVQQYMATLAGSPGNIAAVLTDGDGSVITASYAAGAARSWRLEDLGIAAGETERAAAMPIAGIHSAGDRLELVGAVRVCEPFETRLRERGCGFLVLVEELGTDIAGVTDGLRGRMIYDILAILALAALMIVALDRAIVARMRRIGRAMAAFAGGDTAARSGLRGRDELAEISRATDRMLGRIAETQRQLSESWFRYHTIFNNNTEALIVIDAAGTVTEFNAAAEKMFGYAFEEVIGHNVAMLMPEPDRGRHDGYLEAYRTTGVRRIIGIGREVAALRKDGEVFPIRLGIGEIAVGEQRFFIGTITDLTAMKSLEAQLRRAQKMEAVGQLTGGIVHDFNNLLGIIIGNLDLLQRRIGDDETLRQRVEKAQAAASRGTNLTRRLLGFSRQSVEASSPVNIGPVIEGLRDLIGRSLTQRVSLELFLADGLWQTEIDPNAFEDVLINMALNASDAMPEGGRLIVETCNRTIDAGASLPGDGIRPGDYVEIAVADDGCGIPAAIRDKIFDPFFTTKEAGKGTGLGLATAYGFAKRSGGHITVYSEPGIGTTFKIYLPRAEGQASHRQAAGEDAAETMPRGQEAILIVDDEADLVDIAAATLKGLGYRTATASSGAEALHLLQDGLEADLLFTDVVMAGGMDGFALAGAARKLRPGLKVLVASGFTGRMAGADVDAGLVDTLLAKPYRHTDLARRIRQVLDKEG